MEALNGKKTYILAGLGALAAAILYAQQVVAQGFSFDGLLHFINSEAIVTAMATIRLAIAKK